MVTTLLNKIPLNLAALYKGPDIKLKRKTSIFISLLLLLTLSVGAFFYYAYLSFAEISVKAEAQISLSQKNPSQLDVIKIPAAKFNTQEHELWHEGRLYDISSYKIVDDTVVISVLHDEQEEGLVQIINEYFSSPTDPYTGNHISSKHSNPNDVKNLCEGIKIVSTAYYSQQPVFIDHSIGSHIHNIAAVDGPPPRA